MAVSAAAERTRAGARVWPRPALAFALAVAVGCGVPQAHAQQPVPAQPPPVLPTQTPARGGTLTWAMGAPPQVLAPYLSVAPAAAQIGAKIYDGLLEYDDERRPLPSLAERWQVSPDGRTITFHLRRHVVFHDGQPFTAADVRFSILDVLRRHHPRGATIFRNVTTVRTPDAHTAVLELSAPAPTLMAALAGHESPMVPRHALADVIGKPDRGSATLAVGTGPFKLAARDGDRGLRLVRHAKYWRQGLPLLDAIDVSFVPGDADRAALLESNGAHVVSGLDTGTVHRLKASGTHRAQVAGADAMAPIAVLSLNTAQAPFDRPQARRAVALALDKPALIAAAWHGFGTPATGPLPAAFLNAGAKPAAGPAPSAAATTRAIDLANSLLDSAGLKRRDDGIRLTLVHDVAPLGPDWQRLAEGIEHQLARVGIKVASRFETIEAWMRRLSATGDFAMASHMTYGLSDPVLGLHRTLHGSAAQAPSAFTNSARWQDAAADALLDKAAITLDPFERVRTYRALQAAAIEAAPMVWLAELTPPVLVQTQARRVMTAPHGLFGNFSEAYIAVPEPARRAASASNR